MAIIHTVLPIELKFIGYELYSVGEAASHLQGELWAQAKGDGGPMVRFSVFLLLGLFIIIGSVQSADFESVLREARQLDKAGKLQQAIDVCSTITNARPGGSIEPRVRLFLGHLLIKGKRPSAEIISQFARIAEGFPDSPEAPEALLRIGYIRDKAKESPVEWQRIVDKYPKSREAALALYRMGFVALKQNDPDLAVKRFLSCAEIEQADTQCAERSLVEAGYAHISRYWKTANLAAISDAMTHLTALQKTKLSAMSAVRVHLALGEACLIVGYCKDAAAQYQAALDLDPDDVYLKGVAQFELGCAQYGKGDWESAVKAYDQFLTSQAGSTLIDKDQQWRSTRPGYNRLIVEAPEKTKTLTGLDLIPLAAYWKAESLRRLNRCSEARTIAEEVLAGFPDLSVWSRVESLRDWCAAVSKEAK